MKLSAAASWIPRNGELYLVTRMEGWKSSESLSCTKLSSSALSKSQFETVLKPLPLPQST